MDPVEVTPSLAVLRGVVTSPNGAFLVSVRVDARVHRSDCFSPQVAGDFNSPAPLSDAAGQYELVLRAVVAPSLHCVQVVAHKTGAADSVVVELSQVRFRFAPLADTVRLDIVVP
jgi:hypothetical protein